MMNSKKVFCLWSEQKTFFKAAMNDSLKIPGFLIYIKLNLIPGCG